MLLTGQSDNEHKLANVNEGHQLYTVLISYNFAGFYIHMNALHVYYLFIQHIIIK